MQYSRCGRTKVLYRFYITEYTAYVCGLVVTQTDDTKVFSKAATPTDFSYK